MLLQTLYRTVSVAALFAGVFSPVSLFAASEPGVWYDPSDLTTLFQDSAGTTPVTAVEQPVGLMLDKSRKLAIGAELAPTTDYSSGWTTQAGTSLSGSGAVYTNCINNNSAYASAGSTLVLGGYYLVTYTITSLTAGGLKLYVGGATSTITRTTPGTYTEMMGSGGGDFFVALRAVGTTTATITSFSIKPITGTHAYQSGAAARPVLSARVNLATKTEDFSNAVWVAGVTTKTANYIYPNSSGLRYVYTNVTTTVGVSYTVSVELKPSPFNWVFLSCIRGSGSIGAYFNIANGTVGTILGGVTATITPTSNGFYRCSVTNTASTTTGNLQVVFSDGNGVLSVTANGTDGYYIQKADVRTTNQGVGLPVYQYVNTSTDYTSAGFPMYLKCDGVDDYLLTPSTSFTTTDKMLVVTGNTDLVGGAGQVTCSFGVYNAAGTWALFARDTVDGQYNFYNKGALTAGQANITSSYPAVPSTLVVTGYGDIAAPQTTLRVNGVQRNSVSTALGGGNYGTGSIYLGMASVGYMFNGRIYSLIVRAAASTALEISNTETWVNSKTKAY